MKVRPAEEKNLKRIRRIMSQVQIFADRIMITKKEKKDKKIFCINTWNNLRQNQADGD